MASFLKANHREEKRPSTRIQDLRGGSSALPKDALAGKPQRLDSEHSPPPHHEEDKENIKDISNLFVDSASGNIKYRPNNSELSTKTAAASNKSMPKRQTLTNINPSKTANLDSGLFFKPAGEPHKETKTGKDSTQDQRIKEKIEASKSQFISMVNTRAKPTTFKLAEPLPKPKSKDQLLKSQKSPKHEDEQLESKHFPLYPYYLKSLKHKNSTTPPPNNGSNNNSFTNTGKPFKQEAKSPSKQEKLERHSNNKSLTPDPFCGSNKKSISSSASKRKQSSATKPNPTNRLDKREANPHNVNLYENEKPEDQVPSSETKTGKKLAATIMHQNKTPPQITALDVNRFQLDPPSQPDLRSEAKDKQPTALAHPNPILESIKKVVITDSGLKRNKSQLRMDELQEIFNDDKQFIESTKKQKLREVSFSDEKKHASNRKQRDLSKDGPLNARKLDFNTNIEFPVQQENVDHPLEPAKLSHMHAVSSKELDLDAFRRFICETAAVQEPIQTIQATKNFDYFSKTHQNSNLNFDKLKIQKRPQNSVDFVSIKNNLKIKKLRKNETSDSELPSETFKDPQSNQPATKENFSATHSVKKLKPYSSNRSLTRTRLAPLRHKRRRAERVLVQPNSRRQVLPPRLRDHAENRQETLHAEQLQRTPQRARQTATSHTAHRSSLSQVQKRRPEGLRRQPRASGQTARSHPAGSQGQPQQHLDHRKVHPRSRHRSELLRTRTFPSPDQSPHH